MRRSPEETAAFCRTLAAQLYKKYKELGSRIPTHEEMLADPSMMSETVYLQTFGASLEEIIAEVQRKPLGEDEPIPRGKYTREQLTRELLEFCANKGRVPVCRELKRHGLASHVTYSNVFGLSWNGILAELGLPIKQRKPER